MFLRHHKKEGGGVFKSLIRTFIINAAALYLISQYVPGFQLNEGFKTLLIISGAFTLLHQLLRPVLEALLGGLNFLTFGILGLLIDAGILFALTRFFPQITLTSWHFNGVTYPNLSLPPYDFNEYSTIALVAFLVNLLQTVIRLLV